jgi:hypothetical protein
MPEQQPAFSIPSVIAIIAAIMSFFAGAGWGFVLALVAIVLGLTGMALAISPRVRGGFISIFSIIAGLLGIFAAILKLLFG